MTQLNFRHVLGLGLIDAEADHKIGDNLCFFLCLPDNFNSLIDIQQDLLQTLQKMKFFLGLGQVKIDTAADALSAERDPLREQVFDTEHPWSAGNKDIEVTGERVLQRGGFIELPHKAVRVGSTLQIDRDLQAGFIGLVADVADFPQLTCLCLFNDLVDDGLGGGGRRNLCDVDAVAFLIVSIFRTYGNAAAAGVQHLPHLVAVEKNLAAAREVRCLERVHDICIGIADQLNCGVTDLL